jgi:hypothetical protein
VKQGQTRALLGSGNELLMFALTSGTTSESKFIPVTKPFLEAYRRGWQVWGITAYDAHPSLFVQDIVQLSSDHQQFYTPGGHPCGNISGMVSTLQSRVVKTMYTVPEIVSKISSAESKYYTALRLSIANRHVGLVMTANPSTLLHMARLIDQHREALVRDIADGTLTPPAELSPDVRRKLRIGRRDRKRARALEAIIHQTGRLAPKDAWPDLSLLAVWTGGSAGAYVAQLPTHYGDVSVRDHGLSASEGRMTVPLTDGCADGVLDIQSHFFEFVPEDEMSSPAPTVLEAHELEAGQNYFILLTTASGLCRYNIRDVVRCTGHIGSTPRLEFLNKGAHISSLTGEKVTESQVVSAMREAVRQAGASLSFYTVAPVWGDPPGYRILIERSDITSPVQLDRLVRSADAALQVHNCEYGEKRTTGRLSPLTPVLLPPGTWHRFTRSRQTRLGGSIEQYKHPCLSPDLKFVDTLLAQFTAPQEAVAA